MKHIISSSQPNDYVEENTRNENAHQAWHEDEKQRREKRQLAKHQLE
jgi:hypothetical protein